MAFLKMQGGFPIDQDGLVIFVAASQAVAPVISWNGFLIDAQGRVLIPG